MREIASPELVSFDYAIVRLVPRVERGEFLNAGVILFCATERFLRARIEFDAARFRVFGAPCEEIEAHLGSVARICEGENAGPLGSLSQRERWHWLVAPRSTIIQMSPVHSGLCRDLETALETLFDKMVRVAPQ